MYLWYIRPSGSCRRRDLQLSFSGHRLPTPASIISMRWKALRCRCCQGPRSAWLLEYISKQNTASSIWADSAPCSERNKAILGGAMFKSRAHDQTKVRTYKGTNHSGHFSMKIPGQFSTEIYTYADHRIATILVLAASATAFQLWSLVHAGRPSRCASARQKRSPSDSP